METSGFFFSIRACFVTICLLLVSGAGRSQCDPAFLRGDSNQDGRVDLSDGVFTLGYLFLGAAEPACLDACDADDSGLVDLTDAIYCFTFLFLGGSPIPYPGPEVCGPDPSEDLLDCRSYDACEGRIRCFLSECCPDGTYCAKEVGDCDGEGECRERPRICPAVWDPVCGCDGRTYSNACVAAAAGVSVAYEGECKTEGCTSNEDCRPESYCAKEMGDCDGAGECRERPLGCPDVWDPVCGCDGRTYGNACDAAAAGVSVLHEDECGGLDLDPVAEAQ